jgi:ATP-dependent RNA helicase RhlB
MKFETLNLDPNLMKGIAEMGYVKCSPVQEQALPESLQGKDMCVQAQTGTGKTGVFLITIIQQIIEKSGSQRKGIKALILVPTRELAVQVEEQAINLCKFLPFKTVSMYGGVGYDKQQNAIKHGVEIAVATPGRLIDFIKSKTVDVSGVSFMVIDEADRMFDMGFMPDVRWILRKVSQVGDKQMMILSATLDSRIRRLAGSFMRDAVEVEIEPDQITVDKVKHSLFHVSREDKVHLLLTLIKNEEMHKLLIFTNMKRTAEDVVYRLNANGLSAEVLTGDVAQQKRLRLVEKFKEGKIEILVATDVAARGIHVDGITHVINFDVPTEAASYVHRIGRTARAGAEGKAYTLACEDLVEHLPDIEKYIEQKIEVEYMESELTKDKLGSYNPRRGAGPRTDRPGPRGARRPDRGGPVRRGRDTGSRSAPVGRKRPPLKSDSRKPVGSAVAAKPAGPKPPRGPAKKMTESERMEHYKKKYGESFSGTSNRGGGKR